LRAQPHAFVEPAVEDDALTLVDARRFNQAPRHAANQVLCLDGWFLCGGCRRQGEHAERTDRREDSSRNQ
jgi:hypothetical protein